MVLFCFLRSGCYTEEKVCLFLCILDNVINLVQELLLVGLSRHVVNSLHSDLGLELGRLSRRKVRNCTAELFMLFLHFEETGRHQSSQVGALVLCHSII